MMEKAQMAVSGTGEYLDWQYLVLLLVLAVQVDFASLQQLRNQHSCKGDNLPYIASWLHGRLVTSVITEMFFTLSIA